MALSERDQELRAFVASLGSAAGGVAGQVELFHEPFLSVDPSSVAIVSRERLSEAVPIRTRLFAAIGASGTHLSDVATIPLDDRHEIVRAAWDVAFAESISEPLQLRSTFLLRREERRWEVLVYLNHQDIIGTLTARARRSTAP